jgi:hypothetical protein
MVVRGSGAVIGSGSQELGVLPTSTLPTPVRPGARAGESRQRRLDTVINHGTHHDDNADQQLDHRDAQGDQGAQDDRWLTIAEAAASLGLSTVSVRRRIRSGQIRARQIRTDRGPAWRVQIGANGSREHSGQDSLTVVAQGEHVDDHRAHAHDQGDAHGGHNGLGSLVALLREREARIDDLTTTVIDRTEAATIWQARAEFLAAQLEMARSEIKALKAPESPVASNLTAESPEPIPVPGPAPGLFPAPLPPSPNAGPWWRRWLSAVYGG